MFKYIWFTPIYKLLKKEVIIIKANYKNIKNQYEIKDNVANITIFKKNGTALNTIIDADDLEKVLEKGTWFAEWHKDFNNYLVQNLSTTVVNGKTKSSKQNLQSLVLNLSSKAPIRHINGNTLDNRKANLEVFERNKKNDYEIVDENTISIILRDKYGKAQSKTLISKDDLDKVVTDEFSWVYYKKNNEPSVVANTPQGRIYLDRLVMDTTEDMLVHHINLNPLDNRRCNLENVEIPEEN